MAGYVQGTQSNGGSNSIKLAFGGSVAAGHAVAVAGRCVASAAVPTTCTDSQGNTYVLAGSIVNGSGATKFQTDVFVAANCSAGVNTVTYSTTATVSSINIAIHEYSGLATTNHEIIDPTGTASQVGTNAAPTTPNATPTNPYCILFGAFGFDSASTIFAPGNMGTGVNAIVRQNYSHLITQDVSALSSASHLANGTLTSGSDDWSALLVTLVAPPVAYPLTPAEIATAAADNTFSVVDYSCPPLNVERYGINSVPGTTDMSGAFNAAIKVAMRGGGTITYGQSGPYLLSNPINCTFGATTNINGIKIVNIGNGGLDAFPPGSLPAQLCSLIASHSQSAAFDFTGCDSVLLENVTLGTSSAIAYPKVGILTARNSYGGPAKLEMRNCRIIGYFGTACYYNYSSEDSRLYNCYFENLVISGADTKTRVYTGSNIFRVTACYATDPLLNPIAMYSAPISSIDHNSFGCIDLNYGGTNTTDCIYIEQSSVRSFGGWAFNSGRVTCPGTAGVASAYASSGVMTVTGSWSGFLAVGDQVTGSGVPQGTVITSFGTGTGGVGTYNIAVATSPPTPPATATTWASAGAPVAVTAGPHGRAIVYVDASASTTAQSNTCSFYGLQADQGFPITTYGVYFGNNTAGVVTHTGWTIDSCNFPNGGGAIGQGVNITLDNLSLRNISQQSGGGLALSGTVQNSTVQYDAAATGGAAQFGTFKNSAYIGDSSQVTVTTGSNINYTDVGSTNKSFSIPTASLSGWTTSGPLSATWTRYANWLDFAITPTVSATWTAAATITIPFSATAEYPVDILDLTAGTLLGVGNISGTTIKMTVLQNANPTHLYCIRGRCAIS